MGHKKLKLAVILAFFIIIAGAGISSLLNKIFEETGKENNRNIFDHWEWWWGNYPELGEGSVVYEVCPVDENLLEDITPLGHIFYRKDIPGAHPIPTEHTYWTIRSPCQVVAPTGGVITRICMSAQDDYSVEISHTNTFRSKFYHIRILSSNILENVGELHYGSNSVYIPVKAGDPIGIPWLRFDFGAYDRTVKHFIHPEKYCPEIASAVCPLDYFKEPLRSRLLNLTLREIEPRGGQHDFDEPGKLVGNWILENTLTTCDNDGWKKFVAFVYDLLDPRYLAVSLSAEALPPYGGLFRVKGNGPDFREIDVNSGEVVYKLMETLEGVERLAELYPDRWFVSQEFVVQYTLLVKMIDNERIKLEVFPGDVPNPTFTENAKYYTR
ncbi:MAG: hypothetical protein QXX33_01470 [Candidatus Hadarchaeales archaeon]